jgi:hypothetical protein
MKAPDRMEARVQKRRGVEMGYAKREGGQRRAGAPPAPKSGNRPESPPTSNNTCARGFGLPHILMQMRLAQTPTDYKKDFRRRARPVTLSGMNQRLQHSSIRRVSAMSGLNFSPVFVNALSLKQKLRS